MAESILDIVFRTKKVGDGETKVQGGLKKLSDQFQNMTGISLSAAGAIGAVVGALKYSVDQAVESEKTQAQLNAVMRSTGEVAGLNADEINSMAEEMSNLTAIEGNAIVAASSVMLTFTSIKDDVFPGAMQAALDLSQAMGQDLQSSVVQIGKALNDPIAGITALSRVGVSFTEQQKEMIKTLVNTGNVMGAQQLILDELNKEFGGSAAAAADTYEGKLKKLSNTVGDLAENIGSTLVPALSDSVGRFNDGLNVIKFLAHWNENLKDAVEEHGEAVITTAASYDEYVQEMTRAMLASGQFDQFTVEVAQGLRGEADSILAAREQLGLLTEAQWQGVYAAEQWNSTQREAMVATNAAAQAQADAGAVAEETSEQWSGLAPQFRAIADAARESAQNAEFMADKARDLAAAEGDLRAAEDAWSNREGGDIASMLKENWLGADKYQAALSVVDEVMGTNLHTEDQLSKKQQELVNQYNAGTISLDAFKKGLEEIKDQFMPFDKSVESSTEVVRKLNAELEKFRGVHTAVVRVINVTDTENSDDLVTEEAAGGPVYPMRGYMVGENGPEFFRPGPGKGGTIIPNGASIAPSVAITGPVNIYNDMDVEELLWRITERLR